MRNMMILLASMLVTACSGSGDSPDSSTEPVALVTLAPAEQGSIPETVTLYGATEAGPSGKHILSTGIEAIVKGINAPVGTAVAAGQIVARLAPTPTARLDIAKASSDARAADQAFARAKRLHGDALVGDAEVETAQAAAAAADATLASLSGRSGALTLRAPVNGYVEAIAANPGDVIQAGAPVVTIAQANDLRVRFGVDPATARNLHPGGLIMTKPSIGGSLLRLNILSITPVVDPQTRLAAVFSSLPPHSRLAVGEMVSGQALTGPKSTVPIIPYAALLDDGGQPFVYVVKGGVAHRRDVNAGPANGERIAISKGLSPGDMVIVQGGTAIEDGMKVRTR